MCIFDVNMKVNIDKGIVIPNKRTDGRPYKYPWHELKIGDSFLMENDHSASSMLKAYNSKLPKPKRIKIKTCVEKGKRRVWRVK